jgi:PEP-CTERM motif
MDMKSSRCLIGALCLSAFARGTLAIPVVPTSYEVTTDTATADFAFTFNRTFNPSLGDEFQVWTVDGTGAYEAVLDRAKATGIEHPNFMESSFADARLFSSAAAPASMVVFRRPATTVGQAQLVSVTPFFPGTQDNGADDYGGWGRVQGYADFTMTGPTIDVSVPLSLLGMSGEFTYFFETFQSGASAVDAVGDVAQWLGVTNVAFSTPLAIPAVTPIPEPETYLLMLVGSAGVAVANRRRKSARRRSDSAPLIRGSVSREA